ncbi:MAG: ATP-binding protein [Roseiflexaceae bacterium]
MAIDRHRFIESWTEDDLLKLPPEETDLYEYKSSLTPIDDLKKKVATAGSAFWNSGGGIFIAGISKTGTIDGGFPQKIGRQSIRDWVDQALMGVEPLGPYAINPIEKSKSTSAILDNHVVLVISFGESHIPPHMAPDKKYYIRAGAHSGPASHSLVEAIRLRRGMQMPLLRGIFREHAQKPGVVQLVVASVNQATALDVSINFVPVPRAVAEVMSGPLPLHISVIDKDFPFIMDISLFGDSEQSFGAASIELQLEYSDILGRMYHHTQMMHPRQNYAPLNLRVTRNTDIEASLLSISKHMEHLIAILDAFRKKSAEGE